jgi:hypothetical protein
VNTICFHFYIRKWQSSSDRADYKFHKYAARR